jgi:hypothetical protein
VTCQRSGSSPWQAANQRSSPATLARLDTAVTGKPTVRFRMGWNAESLCLLRSNDRHALPPLACGSCADQCPLPDRPNPDYSWRGMGEPRERMEGLETSRLPGLQARDGIAAVCAAPGAWRSSCHALTARRFGEAVSSRLASDRARLRRPKQRCQEPNSLSIRFLTLLFSSDTVVFFITWPYGLGKCHSCLTSFLLRGPDPPSVFDCDPPSGMRGHEGVGSRFCN